MHTYPEMPDGLALLRFKSLYPAPRPLTMLNEWVVGWFGWVIPGYILDLQLGLSAREWETVEERVHTTTPAQIPGTAEYTPSPLLEQIRHVADGVTVRQQIPASCAVAVVVEPAAEDEIGGYAEEEAVRDYS